MNQVKLNDSLIKFSRLGMTKEVAKCLELGADVHAWFDFALRWAAENGHTETVKFLLENGPIFMPVKITHLDTL